MKKLTLLIVALLISIASFAQSGKTGNLTWSISNDTLTISGNGAMPDYNYSTSPWDSHKSSIKVVTIEQGVTSIGNWAFLGCSGLTSVTIPNSVTSIRDWAFLGCSKLTSIPIPNSVTHVGLSAFGITDWLNNQPDGVVYAGKVLYTYKGTMPANTAIVINEGTVGISPEAFWGCSELTSVTIPNSVTNIGAKAFSGTAWFNNQADGVIYAGKVLYKYKGSMPANTSIVIDEGTFSVATAAFSDCSGLSSITIPNSVISIDEEAFSYCSGLTFLTIGNSVTSIGNRAFNGCSRLTSVIIPNSVTSIGNGAFNSCGRLVSIDITSRNPYYSSTDGILFTKQQDTLICFPAGKSGNYTIPNSVTFIGDYAFNYCTGLSAVIIPNSVTSIGESAFSHCSRLTSLTIPNSVTSIGSGAFGGCSGLTSLTIPNSVTSIGRSAFYSCSGLTSVTIPNSVTSIGGGAFSDCIALTTVNFNADSCVNDRASYPFIFLGCSGDSASLVSLFNNTNLQNLNIGNNVKAIPDYAFLCCSNLTSVNIPNSVTHVGYLAFEGTAWYHNQPDGMAYASKVLYKYKGTMPSNTTIAIKHGTSSITDYAFRDCTGLISLTIPGSISEIGENTFYNCISVANIYVESLTPALCRNNSFIGIDTGNCTLHVPSGSKSLYQTAVGWRAFVNIVEDVELPDFTISVMAALNNGGAVSGGGSYKQNTIVSLQATPKPGYVFYCWKEGEDSITKLATYSFTAMQNRTLTAVFVPADVIISPDATSANIAWNTVDNATGYTLIIYTDSAKTQEYARFEFDANGNLLTKTGFYYNLTGLNPETPYYYSIVATDANNQEIKTYIGNFTTLKTTGIEEAETEEAAFVAYPSPTYSGKLTIESGKWNSQIAPSLRGTKQSIEIFDLMGKLVGTFAITGEKTEINIGHLPSGTYFVKVGNAVRKITKR